MAKHKKIFPWQLGIFPLFELILFLFAYQVDAYFLSFSLVLLASIMLSFSIHIFFHECVHVRNKYPLPINILFTLFLGLPFDGYRIHHLNHHTYCNKLDDFSSTWHVINGKKTAYSIFNYCFFWLRQVKAAIYADKPFDKKWGDVETIKARIPSQKITLFFFILILVFISVKALLLYLILVFFGWMLTSLHNYGQHPPINKNPVYTYDNKTFNIFFFNNGLHWEHHEKPWLSWDQINVDANSPRIHHAHLINPLFKASLKKS